MNFADIEHAWRSPQNAGDPGDLNSMKTKLNAELRNRRRGFAVFLGLILAVLTALTVTIVAGMQRAAPGQGIDPAREWASFLTLGLPWVAALVFVVRFLRHRREHSQFERSIQDSVRASLDENRFARSRVKTVAAIHGLLLLLLPLVVYQLRATGKAGDEILIPAFVIWPTIALGIGAALLYHYRKKLVPERRDLEALLAQYGEQADSAR